MRVSEAAPSRRVVLKCLNQDPGESQGWEVYLREEGSDPTDIARERFENPKVAALYARELMRLFGVAQLDEES
jgi:hypothetical protein